MLAAGWLVGALHPPNRTRTRSGADSLVWSHRRVESLDSMSRMDALIRIKRLVVARRVEFTMKAETERLRDGLSVEDVLESIVNANAIKKGAALAIRHTPDYERPPVRHREPDLWWNLDLHERRPPPKGRSGDLLCPRLVEALDLAPLTSGPGRVPSARAPRSYASPKTWSWSSAVADTGSQRRTRTLQGCGERIFGLAASQQFDALLRQRRRTSAA